MNKKDKLLKMKATIVALGVLGGGVTTMSGCSNVKPNDADKNEIVKSNELLDEIMGDVSSKDTKVFEPYEHYLSVRIQDYYEGRTGDIPGFAINNIPEGYEVYSITPFTERDGYGSRTGGFDIWFVNNETVEVTATFNEEYSYYGYFTFGKVVEKELTK